MSSFFFRKNPRQTIKHVKIAPLIDYNPPPRSKWKVIGGYIDHVTGLDSVISIFHKRPTGPFGYMGKVSANLGTEIFPLGIYMLVPDSGANNQAFSVTHMPQWFSDEYSLLFTGDATASAWLIIIEAEDDGIYG